jgi:hypothetical protein
MIVQCCSCKKIRKGSRWITMRTLPETPMRISHGYCPECAAKVYAEIRSAAHARDLAAASNG